MNKFNVIAEQAGREFFEENPRATGSEVDDAAPKLEPARRYFQNGFYFAKHKACTCSEAIRTLKPHFMCDHCLDRLVDGMRL